MRHSFTYFGEIKALGFGQDLYEEENEGEMISRTILIRNKDETNIKNNINYMPTKNPQTPHDSHLFVEKGNTLGKMEAEIDLLLYQAENGSTVDAGKSAQKSIK